MICHILWGSKMSVAGLRFVITGGAMGMGAATAKLAAYRGAKVVIADLSVEKGEAVVASIREQGGEAWFRRCDLTRDQELEQLMSFAADSMGGIDVLHSNAGVMESTFGSPEDYSLANFSRDIWDKVIAVNLTAPMFASKAALPYLKQSSQASIIIAASVSSLIGNVGTLAYGASKGGVALLTKNLAVELATAGIRVNSYCPGVIGTEMMQEYCQASGDPEGTEKAITNTQLITRLGKPEEVAELVCFLASDKSLFVNGVVWPIDGGMSAWRGTADSLPVEE